MPNDPTVQRRPRTFYLLIVAAILVGCVGGIGAYAFRHLIGLFHNLSFHQTFSSFYDANEHTAVTSPIWIPLIVLPVGAIVVTWLVRNFAPEAKGHGVPEVLQAVHFERGQIRPVVVLIKALASSITIGTGGSAGREGPIVQIGAAFGSTLGGYLDLGRADRTTLLAAGAGAGIAATFNAPLGGVLFAVELFLFRLNFRSIGLIVLAVVAATFVGQMLMGAVPSFDIPALQMPDFAPASIFAFGVFGVFGLVIGAFSALFIRGLYWTEDAIERVPLNEYVRNALGMAIVAGLLIALQAQAGHYYVEGVGYATIMDILTGVLADPVLLLTLALLKLAVTCMTIGFGGSGGIFSPCLVMGGCLGAGIGVLAENLFPGLGISVPSFALVGMAAMAAATTGAFFASVVMLVEMSGDASVMVPVMLCAAVAWLVRHAICEPSIYNLKLLRRGLSVPESYPAGMMAARTVGEVMNEVRVIKAADADRIEGTMIDLNGTSRVLANSDVIEAGLESHSYIFAEPNENLAEAIARRKSEGAALIVVPSAVSDGRLFVISDAELSADYADLAELNAGR